LWQSGGQFVADRYSYFPAMLLALATAGVPAAWFTPLAPTARLRTAQFAAAALLLALLTTTTQQVATWRDSLTLWRRAVDCVPDNALAWSFLAQVYQQREDLEQTQACYDRAASLNPPSSILVNAGAFAAATGQTQKARALYDQALTRSPDDPDAHYNLANLLIRTGSTETAVDHYAAAWRLSPTTFRIAANYGRALLVAKRPAAAAEIYRAAVQLEPEQALGWEGLGAALLAQGDLAGACTALARGQACSSATPHGARLWAQVLDKQGDREAARCVLGEARQRWPEQTAREQAGQQRR
jgi:Tfp pilus assembly protein PilF